MNYFVLDSAGIIVDQFFCEDPSLASELGGIPAVSGFGIGDRLYGSPFYDKQISDLETENALLKAQLRAQTERSDFIEDCIAEMATQVYAQ